MIAVKWRDESGITLLEVLVAMIIFAIGVLGLAPLLAISMTGNSYSNNLSEANALAQGEIETLMEMDDYGLLPYMVTVDSVNGRYTMSSIVEDNSTNALVPSGVLRLHVLLSWVDDENKIRQVEMSTFKPISQ